MKHSLNLILWLHDSNARNQHPIYVKITIDRKTSYISTGEWINKNQWDSKNQLVKNHPLSTDINARITNKKSVISRKITDISLEGITISARELKAMFTGRDMHNVFEFTESFIKEVTHKREPGTLENYRKHLLKLEQFNGGKELSFEQITTDFLSRYETYLRKDGLGNNYVHALFKTLKTFFNAAIKKGFIKEYPFNKYENPVYIAPIKDYLNIDEIKAWEKFADTTIDPTLKQTAVYFLLGVCTGIRISDWFRFRINENIKDGKVLLRAKKNGEWVTMPVNNILKRNLSRINEVPLTIEEPTINEKLKLIAKKLEIKKHITSHTARHTFAITLCAEKGISSETCAELMGITINTCIENYYRVTSRKIDSETLKAWKGL